MTFWTSQAFADPVKSRNFRVRAGTGKDAVWWWAKSVTKPSVEFSEGSYLLANTNFKIPGIATWNDVTITFVEVGNKVKELYESLSKSGYGFPSKVSSGDGYTKSSVYTFMIETYGSATKEPIEVWTLSNAFVKSIDFGGEMNYSSDELMAVSVVVSYDWAELEVDGKSVTSAPTVQKPSATPAADIVKPPGASARPVGVGTQANISKAIDAKKGTEIGDCSQKLVDENNSLGYKSAEKSTMYVYATDEDTRTICVPHTVVQQGGSAILQYLEKTYAESKSKEQTVTKEEGTPDIQKKP